MDKVIGERLRILALSRQAQCKRFGADRDVVRVECGKRAPEIAQPLLAYLRQSPKRRLRGFVRLENVRIPRPVERAGIGDAAAERVAVSADVFGQRIDDERRTDA